MEPDGGIGERPSLGLRVTGPAGHHGDLGRTRAPVVAPEAVASALPLPVGVEVKLGTLVLLVVLTLICSLVPICVLRRPGASSKASAFRHKVLSLVSCFAGGVFLATYLLDLLPDYLTAIDDALAALHVRPGSITPTSGQRTHP